MIANDAKKIPEYCAKLNSREVNGVFIFDNSCNHECYPADALRADKMNVNIGHKGIISEKNEAKEVVKRTYPTLRNGEYNGSPHNNYFAVGDQLLVKVSQNQSLKVDVVASKIYEVGYVISEDDIELIGVLKGRLQILLERGIACEKHAYKKVAYVKGKNAELAEIRKGLDNNFEDEEQLAKLREFPDEFLKRAAIKSTATVVSVFYRDSLILPAKLVELKRHFMLSIKSMN